MAPFLERASLEAATPRQVDASLEIRVPDVAQQVGPVGQGGLVFEVEGNALLHCWQQAPSRGRGGGAGHLDACIESFGHPCSSWQRLKLCLESAWNQKQNAHRGRRIVN
jgi:hypothetical protein